MTWDLTSILGEMSPVAINYLYQHASNGAHKDSFVSSGGVGLTFPSQYPDIDGLVSSISQSMQAADQQVISILDPSYDAAKLYAILNDPHVMGMMFKTYANYYKGRDGALEFHNGKPIMSVKYSLWDCADTALSIAGALNASTHSNPVSDSASYSIVNVHPWSTLGPTGSGSGDPMSNLNQLVQWLDLTKVEVVTLEELMVHLRNNFGAPLTMPGDYTNNGSVDAADYVLWRNGGPLQNDATPGVQPTDYAMWKANFGRTSGSGAALAAVPEPAAAGLALMGIVGLLRRRNRRLPC